jgi:hypothetical protein
MPIQDEGLERQGGNPIQLKILKVTAEKILDASVDRAVV